VLNKLELGGLKALRCSRAAVNRAPLEFELIKKFPGDFLHPRADDIVK
jgi:hypothetical protein